MRRVLVVPAAVATLSATAAGLALGGVTVVAVATPAVTATGPQVAIYPSSVSFGTQRVGSMQQRSVTVQNVGNAPLHMYSVSVSDFTGSYTLAFNGCAGATLSQGQMCQFVISFHPRAAGQHTANAYVQDDAPSHTQSVSIWGQATP